MSDKKYIDAEWLYNKAVQAEHDTMEKIKLYDFTDKRFLEQFIILDERTKFKHAIMDAPKADVVEMPVRCKDCIYCEQLTLPTLGVLFNCRYFLKTVGRYGNGFCSWGVKYSQAEGKEVRNDDVQGVI